MSTKPQHHQDKPQLAPGPLKWSRSPDGITVEQISGDTFTGKWYAIAVYFDNAPAVVLTENFLLHALTMLLHDASTLNPRPACVARIQDALTVKRK